MGKHIESLGCVTAFSFDRDATLQEANTASSNGRLFKGVTIIKSGLGNLRDRHLYTPDALKEAVSDGLFDDLAAYIDHPTSVDEQIQPERTFRDFVGVYQNPAFIEEGSGGRVVADFQVLKSHNWLAEGIRDLVGLGLGHKVGISILGSGRTVPDKYRLEEGETIDVHRVDKFTRMKSADIVTQAGAGGGFQNLTESAVEAAVMERKVMDVKDILSQIKEAAEAGDTAKVLELNGKLTEAASTTTETVATSTTAAVAEATDEEKDEKSEDDEASEADATTTEAGTCGCGKVKEGTMPAGKSATKTAKGQQPRGRKFGESDSDVARENAQLRKDNAKLKGQLDAVGLASYINEKLTEAAIPATFEPSLRRKLSTLTDKAAIDAEIEYQKSFREAVAEDVLSGFDKVEGAGAASLREGAGHGGTSVGDKIASLITGQGLSIKAKK